MGEEAGGGVDVSDYKGGVRAASGGCSSEGGLDGSRIWTTGKGGAGKDGDGCTVGGKAVSKAATKVARVKDENGGTRLNQVGSNEVPAEGSRTR